jgi:hypothetical protein
MKRNILSSTRQTLKESAGLPRIALREQATKESSSLNRHLPKATSSEKSSEEGRTECTEQSNLARTNEAKAGLAALRAREDIIQERKPRKNRGRLEARLMERGVTSETPGS